MVAVTLNSDIVIPLCVTATTSFISNQWGKCMGWNESTDSISVTSNCDKFIFTESNRIKHLVTGSCIIPESHDLNAKLRLTSRCEELDTIFQYTENERLEHLMTGYCVQTRGAAENSSVGNHYLIHFACKNRNSRFFAGKKFVCFLKSDSQSLIDYIKYITKVFYFCHVL